MVVWDWDTKLTDKNNHIGLWAEVNESKRSIHCSRMRMLSKQCVRLPDKFLDLIEWKLRAVAYFGDTGRNRDNKRKLTPSKANNTKVLL